MLGPKLSLKKKYAKPRLDWLWSLSGPVDDLREHIIATAIPCKV